METIATISMIYIALHIMFSGDRPAQAPPQAAGNDDQKREYPKRKA